MPRLFVFAIGGTGARVMRSLGMLLGAGVKLEWEIVPILIDIDKTNGDTVLTEDLLRQYLALRKKALKEVGDSNEISFFQTPITTLGEIAKDAKMDQFRFPFELTNQKSFRDFIGFDQLSREDSSMLRLLFPDQFFDLDLTGGFYGNPNIGAIGLNLLTQTEQFQLFESVFQDGDRVFIASSIFGGTGAAGFPILLKKLNSGDDNNKIRKAKKGALSVLPYFNITPDEESPIDSNSFMLKAKSALLYYQNQLQGLDHLYYVADTPKASYPNEMSGSRQKNSAHITEFVGAMSIIDFAQSADTDFTGATRCFEFVSQNKNAARDPDILDFYHFGDKTLNLIQKPMTQFLYLRYIMNALFNEYPEATWVIKLLSGITNLRQDPDLSKLADFSDSYLDWLQELSDNRRSFRPFDLNILPDVDLVNEIVVGRSISGKSLFGKQLLSADTFLEALGKFSLQQKISNEEKLSPFLKSVSKSVSTIYDKFIV